VYIDQAQQRESGRAFESNRVVTSKYNIITFLPIFLFEMFSRVAYLYFLLQAGLSWWSVISPFSGYGSTAALVFVLAVAAVKAIWEDVKRHHEDKRMNTSITHRVNPDGSVSDIPWTEVEVGNVIMVRDDELFPADLMCLYSNLAENVCFIKTTNLDGETNLKIRKPVDLKGIQLGPEEHEKETPPDAKYLQQTMELQLTLTAEDANKNLHKFRGKAQISDQRLADTPQGGSSGQNGAAGVPMVEVPVTMNEMLLRGCMLKNSGFITGLVVYTGKETRIQMNAAKTPLKVGSFDRFLNLQIALVIAMQLAMCLFCAIANYIWIQKEGSKHYYLALNVYVEGNWENPLAQICLTFLTFWILLSYLVPISLFVTLEIVKFWQGFVFINFDRDMRDPKTREWARCRNSNLNEDLGKIEYIFSDKTGTLTSNEMQLRQIAVKGVAYGSSEMRLEEHSERTGLAALRLFDQRLYKAAAKVQRSSSWSGLITAGGSRRDVMAHPNSYPNLDSQGSLGIADEAEQSGVDSGLASGGSGGQRNDWEEGSTALGHHLIDFWTNICLCQSLIIEKNPEGPDTLPFVYQGPSPDEIALVDAARQMGFEFKQRTQSSITLNMLGQEVTYEVLNVMEYTSDRGCMSVIARSPDGTIRVFCKGSDAKVMMKVREDTPEELVENTNANLHFFAKQGLRTLVIGTKIIGDEEYQEWDQRYQEAASSFVDRDEKLDALGKEIEQGLELIGVTAIEDKLQDGVPAAIQTLLDASIRVWMITGDKQETAINIAVSCALVKNPDEVMVLNVDDKSETAKADADAMLDKFLRQVAGMYQAEMGVKLQPSAEAAPVAAVVSIPADWQQAELAVDGPSLTVVLGDDDLRHKLAVLAAHCSGVVVSRSSPSQKAAIVKMMTKYEMWKAAGTRRGLSRWYARHKRRLQGKMLSIGDGANDVAMLQTADVGIGIMGKEGRQAVNNSDYAIAQFRYLVPLLLVHGNLSYYRLARLIKYSFYKNITFAFVLFYYQFYNGFSGQALVDSITAAVFNVVFTSLPILLFSILDRPVKNLRALIRYPKLYDKRNSRSLTTMSFWKTGVLLGVVHGAVCFFIPYYSLATSGKHNVTDIYSLGKIAFVALLGTVTLEVALVARYWTWLFGVLTVLSYVLVYPYLVIFPLAELGVGFYDPTNIGVSDEVLASATFWLVILVRRLPLCHEWGGSNVGYVSATTHSQPCRAELWGVLRVCLPSPPRPQPTTTCACLVCSCAGLLHHHVWHALR
jgi:phospholipid-translocating P-type ATPase (flippase)